MSSAAVSTPYTSAAEGSAKRRSIFKPSTWKKSNREQAHDALEHAGADAPKGTNETGLNTIDGVETGAPLTSLVGGEAAAAGSSSQPQPSGAPPAGSQANQAEPSQSPSQPSQAQPPSPPKEVGSGIPHTLDAQGRIAFFRQDQPNYHLSNSSPAYPLHYNGIRYATAEHLFQSLKFPDRPDLAAKVRRAKTPSDAMRIARSHTSHYPAGWFNEGLNVKVMHDVVLVKFSQWGKLREALLETEERVLVNDSPTDVFWGDSAGRGRNVLGKVLMDVREVLRENSGVRYGSGAKTM
ncbi:Conserved hypothetical protein CHP02464 [Kalmanozyma brasiliensis GHG001]|uniref:NADAR domain-containing protein n=1 Tax=Kalmanozyma brasiliensis (strain GHG001) TaxID=1365824 RepID=V5EUS1_KALBG|nr:Conserved hypothetical protein CHP02464 [Kalmanozyma brasiliensis GHG001]EST06933.1 Conserved hypothetical protein CHP02464 [Kalmanozyma brasiliensis GHG001]